MVTSTKKGIEQYIENQCNLYGIDALEHLSANQIAEELSISRPLASQYLNELEKEGICFKVNTRPVYFFHKKAIESYYGIMIQDSEFYDTDEFWKYILNHTNDHFFLKQLIGWNGSLRPIIEKSMEMLNYPPNGLPFIIQGARGVGKKTILKVLLQSIRFISPVSKKMTQFDAVQDQRVGKFILELEQSNERKPYITIIEHAENISKTTQNILLKYMKNSRRLPDLFILLSEKDLREYLLSELLSLFPFIVNVPELQERSKREREELVIRLFRNEEENLGKKIKLSNVVLNALSQAVYKDNIIGLQNHIRLICARSLLKSNGKSIKIHAYDLDQQDFENIKILKDVVYYIDISTYKGSKEFEFFIHAVDAFIDMYKNGGIDYLALNYYSKYKELIDMLFQYNNTFDNTHLRGIETVVADIIQVVVSRRYVNIPGNFVFESAKLLYFIQDNLDEIDRCCKERETTLKKMLQDLSLNYLQECTITDEISSLILHNLEIKTNIIFRILLILVFQRYNKSFTHCNIFGLLICHGRSTASSMADLVNTMIQAYVFDSIDMPLEATVEDFKNVLANTIDRIQNNAQIIILVDMGSLELLGKGLIDETRHTIGLINNVTTRMALHIGYQIKEGKPLEDIVNNISKSIQVDAKIFTKDSEDAILFVSETGKKTSERMMQLFIESLPEQIPVHFIFLDLMELTDDSFYNQFIDIYNILFITGTVNPNLQNAPFLPLEDLINGEHWDMICNYLKSYLTKDQMNILQNNLRNNFTLTNVIQYLSILNPKKLLDNVIMAIDILQGKLGKRLSNKALVALYIHICCMIERLVSKDAILDSGEHIERFKKEHEEFINLTNISFSQISKVYSITITIEEIHYIYKFFNDDKEEE